MQLVFNHSLYRVMTCPPLLVCFFLSLDNQRCTHKPCLQVWVGCVKVWNPKGVILVTPLLSPPMTVIPNTVWYPIRNLYLGYTPVGMAIGWLQFGCCPFGVANTVQKAEYSFSPILRWSWRPEMLEMNWKKSFMIVHSPGYHWLKHLMLESWVLGCFLM